MTDPRVRQIITHAEDPQSTVSSLAVLYGQLCADPQQTKETWTRIHGALRYRFSTDTDAQWTRRLLQIKNRAWRFYERCLEASK